MTRVAAVVVAAGSGTRMGQPKQFLPLAGRPVCEWALKAFLDCPEVVKVALVSVSSRAVKPGTPVELSMN